MTDNSDKTELEAEVKEDFVDLFNDKQESTPPKKPTYEDYAKRNESTDEEVTDTDKEVDDDKSNDSDDKDKVPDKFKGKSTEEIIESYVQLEREYGRKNNDIGELRKLTEQLLTRELGDGDKGKEGDDETSSEVTLDDFYENPNQAVEKALSNNPTLKEINKRLESAEKKEAENLLKQGVKAINEKFGENWQNVVKSDDFIEFVKESPTRTRLYKEADGGDLESADELLDYFKLKKPSAFKSKDDASKEREDALKSAGSEKGGTTQAKKSKMYRSADLIRLKMTNPEKYASMSDEIMTAYREGRVK